MNTNYAKYKELDKEIDSLFEEKKYEEAISKLESSYDQFPEYDFQLKVYTLYCSRENKNYKKCLDLLYEGLSKGYFYGLKWEGWDPMKEFPEWENILEKNNENRALVEKNSKMEYKVLTPAEYDKNSAYPLFMILHGDGNGCNIEDFSKEWRADILLSKGFVVSYVQSSQPECTGGFGWTSDYEKTRKEIAEAYNKIIDEHSIDRERVILGGFSGGSMASLNVLMNNTIPLKGIMALCPNETDDCTEKNIQKAAERGSRMVLLEGEKSDEVPFHLELMKSAEKFNMPAIYLINKNTGHNVPKEFNDIINKAVDFIFS